ncbi:MAG: putative hydrocarbon binding protein (contains V4R domain) [Halothiobacillaceae bacterium]|nr:MAG: putative hydrocarbon binding protein (contains V4R domain) [Halothiobacillaceae bacterium]
MSDVCLRKELGDFSSIICLKALVVGLEEVMGVQGARANLILAGRIRGQTIAKNLGLSNTDKPMAVWSAMVREAIGKNGTRLCDVVKVEEEGDILRVFLSETVCSAGEAPGSPRLLTFTQGAIHGALEEITGKKFIGVQTGSVLRGQEYDIIDFRER